MATAPAIPGKPELSIVPEVIGPVQIAEARTHKPEGPAPVVGGVQAKPAPQEHKEPPKPTQPATPAPSVKPETKAAEPEKKPSLQGDTKK